MNKLICECGHEERWHDNEDAHCDKCKCRSFDEQVEANPYLLSGEELSRAEQRAKAGTLK